MNTLSFSEIESRVKEALRYFNEGIYQSVDISYRESWYDREGEIDNSYHRMEITKFDDYRSVINNLHSIEDITELDISFYFNDSSQLDSDESYFEFFDRILSTPTRTIEFISNQEIEEFTSKSVFLWDLMASESVDENFQVRPTEDGIELISTDMHIPGAIDRSEFHKLYKELKGNLDSSDDQKLTRIRETFLQG